MRVIIKASRIKMNRYLLCAAIELGQDVKERDLRDYKLLFFILVQWSSWEVKGQKQKGRLRHLLLILICCKQSLFFLWRL